MSSDSSLQFTSVYKRYGDFTAVNNLSFKVPKGKIFGLLGSNGAGKTTSIRMVLDIVKPSSGEISVLGEKGIDKIRDRIGYLPEERGLYKKSKVLDTICYFGKLKGMNAADARKKAKAMLEQYGLDEFSQSKISALSKGMSQKVQLISTVVHDPELVILDEPFSGLDPVNQQVLEGMILSMAKNGQSIIFSTHVMQHAERLCDHLMLMARGKKIFDGSVSQAKNTLPNAIVVETNGDVARLNQIETVTSVQLIEENSSINDESNSGAFKRWELVMKENSDPQSILQYCFSNNIALRSFEQKSRTLHDVFVTLVGNAEAERKIEMQNRGTLQNKESAA